MRNTVIQIDTREKDRAIKKVISYLDKAGIRHYSSKLFVGDYMSINDPKLVIDRKQNLNELCFNVVQDHKRFISEIERANEYGIKIIFLVEHGEAIRCLGDVIKWENPRLKTSPLAVSGERLFRIISTIEAKYNVEFRFCDKAHTGETIVEIFNERRADKACRRNA